MIYNCKTVRTSQTCDRLGTIEHLNGRWWPPAARPHPSVIDWWAKLDLLTERLRVRSWGLKTSSWSDGCFRAQRHEKHGLPVTTLCGIKRASSGMPDMSPMRQADFRGQELLLSSWANRAPLVTSTRLDQIAGCAFNWGTGRVKFFREIWVWLTIDLNLFPILLVTVKFLWLGKTPGTDTVWFCQWDFIQASARHLLYW